jgi:hypothetical protein
VDHLGSRVPGWESGIGGERGRRCSPPLYSDSRQRGTWSRRRSGAGLGAIR